MSERAIILRKLDPDRDGPALHAIFGDEDSCRFLSHTPFTSVAETVAALKRWGEGSEETSWVVAEGEDGSALGRISMYGGARDVWDAACMISPAARGRGLAARGLQLAIDEMFDRRGARRITADVDPDNAASARTFENLGFQFEGRLRGYWLTHIGERDSLIYGLLRSDPRPWQRLGRT
jgi:RimJ/RimL family protein N-acetyltransferase